jgi:hypothetical protein
VKCDGALRDNKRPGTRASLLVLTRQARYLDAQHIAIGANVLYSLALRENVLRKLGAT